MTKTTTLTALTFALTVTGLPVLAQSDMETGQSMLMDGLETQLNRLGIDTDNVDYLTLAEVAEIRSIIFEDNSQNSKRDQIEDVLDDAGTRLE